ncbi:integumentary mucin C.1-like [Melanotaenia boesemani]|uniref:integumentary mucin C.1-like n=1 Tax=Melanotaenia boesemani TaxID=1250792 RepID=UPI001C05B243|nr:integumentary mucin C.1-like [Melanotaenia boesemani]
MTSTAVPTRSTVTQTTTKRVTFRSAGETFSIDLGNASSEAFTHRAELLKSTLQPLYQNTFASFNTLTVVSFSNGSIINNMDLGFASTSLPNNTQIASVLIGVASNITTFNIDINNISVDGSQVSATTAEPTTTTAAPTTTTTEPTTIKTAATTITAAPTSTTAVPATSTAAPTTVAALTTTKVPPSTPTVALSTTTTTTVAPPPVFILTATLVQPFVQELNNKESQQFKELEKQVVVVYDIIYRARYGLLFIRSFVIAFRPAVARTRSDNTEAEVGVEFNKTASAAEIPTTEQVQETLVQAVTNVSTNFNITFESDSIQVIRTPFTNSTTAAPISNSTATANDTTATAATTTAITATTTNSTATANSTTAITSITAVIDTSTTSTTTISTTTIATTTTVEAITTRRVTFRSAGETFTIDLANPSSQAFTNRAELLKSTLKPLYQNTFASFRSLTVVSFSNGSIINNMDLGFASTSLPSNTEIANVLIKAASNITAFNIDINNISVDGSQVSSGVSHKISLIAASCMVLLSWLLSSQQ